MSSVVDYPALLPSGLADKLACAPARRRLATGLDAWWLGVGRWVARARKRAATYLRQADSVLALEREYAGHSGAALRERCAELRAAFRLGRDTAAELIHGVAAIREVNARELGQRPFRVQVAGALAIVDGCLAEMATGEGKTLTATIPATLAGWRGRGCHIVTVNDYLAARDADWMGAVYRGCGISVGFVVSDTEPDARRNAYAADITYTTSKELAADFLRDRLVLGGVRGVSGAMAAALRDTNSRYAAVVMRGLDTAIVDEADSVLIDEAVTPLIIAGGGANDEMARAYAAAAELASRLELHLHFRINAEHREVELTVRGRERAAELGRGMPGLGIGARRSEELIVQALAARELYHRGKHYLVQDGKIVIVDEFTGRLMPDRTWRDGFHQAVQAKERLAVQTPSDTLARVSFQRYFRMYRRLGGMTGTAKEEAGELWRVYSLPVVRLPTNKPCIRVKRRDRVFVTNVEKQVAVAETTVAAYRRGQPVLVGCRTVAASEALSARFSRHQVPHELLNATRAAEEARIIERAGQLGAVTIATNMAGRGTDIRLGQGAGTRGGLLVIASERHEAARIDRQLFGRSGRQGDPGECQAFVSLEDELITRFVPSAGRVLRRLGKSGPQSCARLIWWIAQMKAQMIARSQRRAVLRADDWLEEQLGFSGWAP